VACASVNAGTQYATLHDKQITARWLLRMDLSDERSE
jgi:hypothetical protein